MLLGAIADDFTGAGDLANTLTREGMRTRLYIGAAREDAADVDAGVVALKSRSTPAAAAVAESLAALAALRALGCRQYLFKYCSTFDSTPAGNIGPVAEALAGALGANGVVVCPAFPANGRTVYEGHLFVHDALISESGMERHPLTPMTDPDIRRWLTRQSAHAPGHVRHATVRRGSEAIRGALADAAAAGHRLVVVDAVSDDDLRAIGAAAAKAPLLTGGSGIALGLPDNFRRAGALAARTDAFAGADGPALVLAGSCSRASQEQVRRYAADHPAYVVPVDRLLAGEPVEAEAIDFTARHRDAGPIVTSTATPEAVAAAQALLGADRAAHAVEALLGAVAQSAVAGGVRRLVVAGGETSGAVVTALGLAELDVGPEIDPGVPALAARTVDGAPLALALKSGNFGAPDFFARAVAQLGRTR